MLVSTVIGWNMCQLIIINVSVVCLSWSKFKQFYVNNRCKWRDSIGKESGADKIQKVIAKFCKDASCFHGAKDLNVLMLTRWTRLFSNSFLPSSGCSWTHTGTRFKAMVFFHPFDVQQLHFTVEPSRLTGLLFMNAGMFLMWIRRKTWRASGRMLQLRVALVHTQQQAI